MNVKILEYGDDPSYEYPEDFNSFKVYEVWSEPGIKTEPDGGPVGSEMRNRKRSFRRDWSPL